MTAPVQWLHHVCRIYSPVTSSILSRHAMGHMPVLKDFINHSAVLKID
jgi:hypothetical protein